MRDILKQIWRFLRIAASGPGKWLSLTLLLFVIGCQLTVIQVNVRLIQWYADFYNALQKLDVPVIVTQIGVFFALAGAAAGLYLVGRYARKVLQIRWRRRLTDTLVQALDIAQGILVSGSCPARRAGDRQSGPAHRRRLQPVLRVHSWQGRGLALGRARFRR